MIIFRFVLICHPIMIEIVVYGLQLSVHGWEGRGLKSISKILQTVRKTNRCIVYWKTVNCKPTTVSDYILSNY